MPAELRAMSITATHTNTAATNTRAAATDNDTNTRTNTAATNSSAATTDNDANTRANTATTIWGRGRRGPRPKCTQEPRQQSQKHHSPRLPRHLNVQL